MTESGGMRYAFPPYACYDGFVEALGRRLARGRKLADEISQDIETAAPVDDSVAQ